MNPSNHIRYCKRSEVDIIKWDRCIDSSGNGLIYARVFYLDHMAAHWDALILNDYEAVMPLTWNRKWGFYYLYQPYYTPVLGLFGKIGNTVTLSSFLQAIPRRFRFWEIDLNETNLAEEPPASDPARPAVRTIRRLNHLLNLDKGKEEIAGGYSRLARRMCRKAGADQLQVIRGARPAEVIGLYRKEYGNRHPKVISEIYNRFTECAEQAFAEGHAATYLAQCPDGRIAAYYLVLSDNKFVYSIMGGSSPEGKAKGAFYLLTDAAIKDHAGTGRIFRFEGSDIPGIASFDQSFGAIPVIYSRLVLNNLPFPVNLLKGKAKI